MIRRASRRAALPLGPSSMRSAGGIPALRQFSVEPARPDVRGRSARLLRRDAAAVRADLRVGAIDDWTIQRSPGSTQHQPRDRPTIGSDEIAGHGARAMQAPCPHRRPRRRPCARRRSDGEGGGEGRRSAVWAARFRRAVRIRSGIRNFQVSCMPPRFSSRRRLRGHDLVVVMRGRAGVLRFTSRARLRSSMVHHDLPDHG